MHKLTITVDDDVYTGLHKIIGKRKISSFLNNLAKPHVTHHALLASYQAMSPMSRAEPGAGNTDDR